MNKIGKFETSEGDVLVNIHGVEWIDVGDGSKFKVLRTCAKTGKWALYVNMQPGASFQAHRHEGYGEFFITEGELIYDVGRAPKGTYGYEPIFAEHFEARCEVETEMLFLGQGAVSYLKDDGSIDYIMNAMEFKKLSDSNE